MDIYTHSKLIRVSVVDVTIEAVSSVLFVVVWPRDVGVRVGPTSPDRET